MTSVIYVFLIKTHWYPCNYKVIFRKTIKRSGTIVKPVNAIKMESTIQKLPEMLSKYNNSLTFIIVPFIKGLKDYINDSENKRK